MFVANHKDLRPPDGKRRVDFCVEGKNTRVCTDNEANMSDAKTLTEARARLKISPSTTHHTALSLSVRGLVRSGGGNFRTRARALQLVSLVASSLENLPGIVYHD